jgi:hypothetical protein
MIWRCMGSGGIAPSFLTSELNGGEWSAPQPCRFAPEEISPGTRCVGGWVGHRASLDAGNQTPIFLVCPTGNPVTISTELSQLYSLLWKRPQTHEGVSTGTVFGGFRIYCRRGRRSFWQVSHDFARSLLEKTRVLFRLSQDRFIPNT